MRGKQLVSVGLALALAQYSVMAPVWGAEPVRAVPGSNAVLPELESFGGGQSDRK